jgi:hypothetical protein
VYALLSDFPAKSRRNIKTLIIPLDFILIDFNLGKNKKIKDMRKLGFFEKVLEIRDER